MPTQYAVVAQLSHRGFHSAPAGAAPPMVTLEKKASGVGRLISVGVAGGDNAHWVKIMVDVGGTAARQVIAAGPRGATGSRAVFAASGAGALANVSIPLDIAFSDGFTVSVMDNGSGASHAEYWRVYELA